MVSVCRPPRVRSLCWALSNFQCLRDVKKNSSQVELRKESIGQALSFTCQCGRSDLVKVARQSAPKLGAG